MTKPIIYIAKDLETARENKVNYGKKVFHALQNVEEIDLRLIANTKLNVWARDFMPVKNADGELVQFTYSPSYMTDTDKWKNRIPVAQEVLDEMNLDTEVKLSSIILDGGNVEPFGTKAIVSDRIFRDNKCTTIRKEQNLLAKLKKDLAVEQLIIIPQHPEDFTGHVDGLVRFVNENKVVINDYSEEIAILKKEKKSYKIKVLDNWFYAFKSALHNAGLEIETLVYTAHLNENNKSAKGIYLNFLLLDELIIMPTFTKGKRENTEIDYEKNNATAQKQLSDIYNKKVITIEASDLSQEGGMINCVTWTEG